MEKMQREYFLREQMKAIQKELGEEDEQAADLRELEERIAAAGSLRGSARRKPSANWAACAACPSRPPSTASSRPIWT